MMSVVYKALRRIKKSLFDQIEADKRLGVAAIHATVLTLLIAGVSAYLIFTLSVVQSMEQETLKEAENINKVEFARSKYFPPHADFSMPNNIEDTIRHAKYAGILLSSARLGLGDVFGEIPGDLGIRLEKTLQLLNVVVHRYPFPESLRKTKSGWQQGQTEYIYFESIASVRKWLDDLDNLASSLTIGLFMILEGRHIEKYVSALKERKRDDLKAWETLPYTRVTGYVDPSLLLSDFVDKFEKVQRIRAATHYYLERAEVFRQGRPSKIFITWGLIAAGLAFFSGVIVPLVFREARRLYLLWIPIAFYVFAYFWLLTQILEA